MKKNSTKAGNVEKNLVTQIDFYFYEICHLNVFQNIESAHFKKKELSLLQWCFKVML